MTKQRGANLLVRAPFCICLLNLNNPGFLQGSVRAVLLDVAHTLSRNGDKNGLAKLRYENAALLEVCLAANLARRVELRSTRTV